MALHLETLKTQLEGWGTVSPTPTLAVAAPLSSSPSPIATLFKWGPFPYREQSNTSTVLSPGHVLKYSRSQ